MKVKNKNIKEYVVLVNENNDVLGTSPKLLTHNDNTPLHRGFSVFLFNQKGELLLQQRGKNKKTWPLVWSNSCCGHPMLKESAIDAAKRRLTYELGINNAEIEMIIPDYRYRIEKDGIVENEICPVMAAFTNHKPKINTEEVNAVRWIKWNDWLKEITIHPENYSEWCVEETKLLNENEKFRNFYLRLLEAVKKLPSK